MPRKRNARAREPKTMAVRTPNIRASISMIPNLASNPVVTRTLRFAFTASGTVNITQSSLTNLIALSYGGTTGWYSLTNSAKIRKITIYSTGGGSGIFGYVAVQYASTQAPNVCHTATGNDVNPAVLVSKPPSTSLASFWYAQVASGGPLLAELTANDTDVVDLDFSFVLSNANDGVAQLTSSTAGSAGQVFYGYLDGVGGIIRPQQINQSYH